MKHLKRFSASLLALGVICAMAVPAGAAADPMNQRSNHAGTVRPVLVVADDGNTVEEYTLNVEIPSDATKGEELALVETAAKQAAGLTMTRSAPVVGDLISTKRNVTLAGTPSAIVVGEGRLQKDYTTLAVTFDDVTARNGADKINVRAANNHGNDNTYGYESLRLGTYTLVYLKTDRTGSHQGGDSLRLQEGDYITVWASTDRGGASVGTVYVSAANY